MDHTRQLDWFDPTTTNAAATIVGCGGIGSFSAFALAKLGVQKLTLMDFDDVEEHNVPNQLFSVAQIGMSKVTALADTLKLYADADSTTINLPLQEGVPLSPVVVSALDSMKARADLWTQIRYKLNVKLFLDGRLGGEHIVLYAIDPTNPIDVEYYESTLHSDSEGIDLPCTGRSIIDVGFAVGSLITRAVRIHYAHEKNPVCTYLDQHGLNIYKGDSA